MSRPLPPEIDGFDWPALPDVLTPGAMYNVSLMRRPIGTRAKVSESMFAPIVVDVVSMTVGVLVTLTVSVTPPTSIFSGMSTVWPRLTMMLVLSAALNP